MHLISARAARAILAAACASAASSCTTLFGDAGDPWHPSAEVVPRTTLSAGGRSTDVDTALGDSEQVVGGLEVDWYDPRAPLGFEAGYAFAHESDVDFHEGTAGIRRTWRRAGLTPFVGGGVSFLSVDPDGRTDFESWGGYAHAGAYWPLPDSMRFWGMPMSVGFDVRGTTGDHASSVEARVTLGFVKP